MTAALCSVHTVHLDTSNLEKNVRCFEYRSVVDTLRQDAPQSHLKSLSVSIGSVDIVTLHLFCT